MREPRDGIAVALPGFEFLIVSRIILVLSTSGFVVVAAITVASKMAPPEKQGSAIATLVMGFSTSLFAILVISFSIPRTDGEEPVPLRKQLALLKEPRIAVALMVTFFWIGGYSIVYTYISPFLLTVTGMSSKGVSAGLFAFGIASVIGSKLGGFSTDKWGAPRMLIGGVLVEQVSLMSPCCS